VCYVPRTDEIPEDVYHALTGGEVDGSNTTRSAEKRKKPFRILDQFTFFDPSRDSKLVVLVEEKSNTPLMAEAVGIVTPVMINDEDAGQEDDLEEDRWIRLKGVSKVQTRRIDLVPCAIPLSEFCIALNPLLYSRSCIETKYAVYVLASPSPLYEMTYDRFNTPQRRALLTRHSIKHSPPDLTSLTGNTDLAVLRKENMQKTTITPLIYKLARDYFVDHFRIVGQRPVEHKLGQQYRTAERTRLRRVVARIHAPALGRYAHRREDRLKNGYYASRITINGVDYSVRRNSQITCTLLLRNRPSGWGYHSYTQGGLGQGTRTQGADSRGSPARC
jgi:hypothetical protein